MPPLNDHRRSSRTLHLLGGAALLLLAGCPGEETPIEDTSSTGSSSTTTPNPNDTTTTLDSGCEGTGGCNPETSVTPIDSTSTGGTEGTGSTGSTGGESSSSSGSTGNGESSSSGGTTEGLSGTTSGSTGGFETGVVFLIEPDVPFAFECDPYLQDCPVGEKCNAWSIGGGSWDALGCFPVDPAPVGVGETCLVQGSGTSGIDNCELGAMCWDVDVATNEGTCVAMCAGSPAAPVCPAGSSCVIANDGVLNLCLPGCDPLLQDCAPGQACYPIGGSFTCAPDASGALGADGDACGFINVCDPGLMCIADLAVENCFGGLGGCCTPFCDVSIPGDPCPAATEECVPFFALGTAPLGLEDVGVCSIP